MTEYDYSPEAFERHMATQTRISNWIDNVSNSMQTPSPTSRHSYDHHHQQQQHQQQHQYQRHSRPTYPQQQQQQHYSQHYPQQHTHSNSHSHSRSNSLTRSRSRSRHQPQQQQQQHYQEPSSRPRSYSQTGSRPQAVHSHTAPIPPPPPPPHPVHSRTYSYAMNGGPPLPGPIPVPQPVPYPHLAPRRSRTLPPQSQNVVYHTYPYDPRAGPPHYVIVPPVIGGGPHGQRQSPVRISSSFPSICFFLCFSRISIVGPVADLELFFIWQIAPTKRAQPLLKRLFTSFGPWGSSSGASPKSKFAPPRRHPRRSSF
jgi:hypothetical protein